MTKPMIRIHNTETNEIVDREMTDEEFTQFENDLLEAKNKLKAENDKIAKRKEILERLGLTEDEVKSLIS